MIVDRFQLAQIFGVTPDVPRTWVRSGAPVHREPKSGPGVSGEERKRLFDSAAIYRWLLERARAIRRW